MSNDESDKAFAKLHVENRRLKFLVQEYEKEDFDQRVKISSLQAQLELRTEELEKSEHETAQLRSQLLELQKQLPYEHKEIESKSQSKQQEIEIEELLNQYKKTGSPIERKHIIEILRGYGLNVNANSLFQTELVE